MDIYQDYIEGCLTFKNPTHHNNGNYTLEASNYLGIATSTVYGHFLDKPYDCKFGNPEVMKRSGYSMTLVEITMKCTGPVLSVSSYCSHHPDMRSQCEK